MTDTGEGGSGTQGSVPPAGETGGGINGGLVGAIPGAPGGTTAGGLGIGGGTAGGDLAGGSADAGVAMDAGVGADASGLGDSAAAEGGVAEEAGLDLADAAPHDGSIEAAGPSTDGGQCQPDSRAHVEGGCQGSYCAITRNALDDAVSSGVCSAAATLALVCEGQIARKTAQCAQDNALSLALGASVRRCLRRDLQLVPVDGGCLDCYVEELLCTLSHCLATCVAGFETACTSCRRENCGATFTRCSGLPAL